MGGTEEGRMEGEMDWSYLSRPRGTNESVWCMMGAGPIRQPITGFGLNGITNHGPWPASSFPISDKPQHIMSIFCPTASCKLPCVYCAVCVCVCVHLWESQRVCTFVPVAVFCIFYINLRRPYMWGSQQSCSRSIVSLSYCYGHCILFTMQLCIVLNNGTANLVKCPEA